MEISNLRSVPLRLVELRRSGQAPGATTEENSTHTASAMRIRSRPIKRAIPNTETYGPVDQLSGVKTESEERVGPTRCQ